MRKLLILIDIDGTLLSPGLAPRLALYEAIKEVTGKEYMLRVWDMAGLTDPLIVRNAMIKLGYLNGKNLDGIIKEVIDRYLVHFERIFPERDDKFVYPDTIGFLEYLSSLNVRIGVLTGNVEKGAIIKLKAFGLDKYFSFGVYGSDSEDRIKLAKIALMRAGKMFGESFNSQDTVIIGDTTWDVICAKENNMMSIAVIRRRIWEKDVLALKPDLVVYDFSEDGRIRNFFDLLLGKK
ncbi:MAG: HAD hydrolase-like protein [Candidatus Marinimicrobia bacterium]|nr:HAD hydrolase-like protein [Candidatus Neomarinimicrobiota bacterium]